MFTAQPDISDEVRDAVNRYLSNHLDISFVSTSAVILAVREDVADVQWRSTERLADYIAARAVEAGFVVRFDARELAD